MKKIDKTQALKILDYMNKKNMDHETARKFIEYLQISAKTTVMRDAFPIMPLIIEKLYNPMDYGKYGKIGEVERRLDEWYKNGRFCCMWYELHARKSGKSDIGKTMHEYKTGAGDWLYSTVNCDFESILNEYKHKQTVIEWHTEFFHIVCTWEQLFDYMATYNDKGAEQFFKTCVKYNAQLTKTVVMLQEWKTSKKKIAFFAACPYNIED